MIDRFLRRRASIVYDIEASEDGWRISCNEVQGPPYSNQSDAIRDTLFTASQLEAGGENVAVRLLEFDGPRKVWRELRQRDAHLYR